MRLIFLVLIIINSIVGSLCQAEEISTSESTTNDSASVFIDFDSPFSQTIITGEYIWQSPVDNYIGALNLITGIFNNGDDLYFQGGIKADVLYLLDGAPMGIPFGAGGNIMIPTAAIDELYIATSGFSAEHGGAYSGLVNISTVTIPDQFDFHIRHINNSLSMTNNLSKRYTDDEVPENLQELEFGLGGPLHLFSNLAKLPGKLGYFIAGNYISTDGRFLNQQRKEYSFFGKLIYQPTSQITLKISGLQNEADYDYFSNLWKKTVNEDQQVKYAFRDDDGDDQNDNGNYITGWYGNGVLDSEDINHNGYLDFVDDNGNGEWDSDEPSEDLNGNNVLDVEDFNHNGKLDVFNMLDHLANIEDKRNLINISVSHQITKKTNYTLQFYRDFAESFWNTNEIINEDIDGDGKLDLIDEYSLTPSGTYAWDDFDNDGYFDRGNEDLNGNGLVDEYGTDLFTDRNSNGYVDASEIGPAPREYYEQMGKKDPESTWLSWGDIPYQGQKDYDGFYTYGSGTTWDQNSWHLEENYVHGIKFDLESQVILNHIIRTGIDARYQKVFYFGATDRYGYGESYRVGPTNFSTYIQDKMEFGSMIMNVGLRYDYFNANWDNYPNNIEDPTWDRDEQLFVGSEDLNNNAKLDPGEDLNGNGVLDQSWIPEKYHELDVNGDPVFDADDLPVYIVYPGEIKDPQEVESQSFISPRFGISYPITVNDKMFFSYGLYFSRSNGNLLYRNLGFDMGRGFPVIGNPKLEPEKTSAYEVGVKHTFKSQSTMELKGFYKNIAGLTDSRPLYFTIRDWYAFYYNNDYGTIRGFEMTFTQRPLALRYLGIGGGVSYTYLSAKDKSSDSFNGYQTDWAGEVHSTGETYADWDQWHAINFNVDMRTTKRMGTLLGDWRANFLGRYGSGMRWTPPKGQDQDQLNNTGVLPYTFTVDGRLSKVFTVAGLNLEFMLDVRNIFNRKNIINIADEEWYAADQDGNGEPDYDPEGKYDDPTVYSQWRLVRFIIQVGF